jgi:lipoprotein-releasing system ATP-binding protein
MSNAASLELREVSKAYPTPAEPLVVLRDVTCTLAPGDAVAIVGPSGSGKSTLLNILGTLDRPSSGSVRFGDVDPFALTPKDLSRFRSQRVGFVFQDHHLLPQCTATENVLMARLASQRVDRAAIDRAELLLRQVGLENRKTHLPDELSGGERQRVSIARALMNQPSLLLCDEPTGNLDVTTGRAVADLIFSLSVQTSVVLVVVTHSAELASRFPRRLRMEDGSLREERA